MSLFNMTGCKFNLPLFNLFLLIIINLQALIYVCLFVPYMTWRFCKTASVEAAENNRRLQNVSCLPIAVYDPNQDQNLDFCVICMDDFHERTKVSWLPCDRRHYFHHECIMFWLVKQTVCPLCKVEVDFEAAQKMKIQVMSSRRVYLKNT